MNYSGSKIISTSWTLWVIFFCFSTMTGLLFQKLLLPLMPSLHGGSGLLTNDAIVFHNFAIDIANNIKTSGWSLDNIWPHVTGVSGNVALLGVLYAIFDDYDPSLILPVNSAIHALSGVLMLLISRQIWPGRIGELSGVIIAVLFVIYPSTLNWYAQVHKDGYVNAGILLVMFAWLRFMHNGNNKQSIIHFSVLSFIGLGLILFVKPYNTIFLSIATGLWLISFGIYKWVKSETGLFVYVIPSSLVWVAFLTAAIMFGAAEQSVIHGYQSDYQSWSRVIEEYIKNKDYIKLKSYTATCINWTWEETDWFPKILGKHIELAAKTRTGLICNNFEAASNIDREIVPNNIHEVLTYMPRTLQIALFGPFPDMWFEPLSLTRLVGAFEIMIWYLLAPGVIFLLLYRRNRAVAFCLLFVLTYLAVYGFTIANMGTLHRIRYPYLMLCMLMGMLGWMYVLVRKQWLARLNISRRDNSGTPATVINALLQEKSDINTIRRKAIVGGWIVAVLTVVSYIGFFLRDVIMAHFYGLGDQLDAFFVAMLLPMFFVNVFCQSFGAASIPSYMEANRENEDQGRKMVHHYSFVITSFLLLLCLVLAVAGPYLINLLGWNFPDDKTAFSLKLYYGAMPLLLLSGMVILGNSILNARMHFSVPAWSQAVVPLFAIGSVLIFGRLYGVAAALAGMVAGQFINFLLIEYSLRREKLSVLPVLKNRGMQMTNKSKQQFISLVISSVFVQLALVIDQGMASSLPSGSVSSLGLGSKAVFFVTGVISAVISMVVLPYFAQFYANRDISSARRELSILILLVTLLGSMASIVMFLLAEPLLKLIFSGGMVMENDITVMAMVVKMGVLQVPFFACHLVLVKFATASHSNKPILYSSLLGLLMNIILNYILMQIMGVAGIALATTISMLLSAGLIMLLTHRQEHVGWFDMIYIGLSWMLFLTMMLCIHYASYAGVTVAAIALIIVFIALAAEPSSPEVNHQYNDA